jgi:hypothetical protein
MPANSDKASGARLSGPVRITLPISVAYDLEKFQAALGNIARSTGHNTCTSGVDPTFITSRDWVVDPLTLEVGEGVTAG